MAKITEETRANISAGVKTSWTNPEIAAKRKKRYTVAIGDTEFRSTFAALRSIDPVYSESKAITFRAALVASPDLRRSLNGIEIRIVKIDDTPV